MHWIKIKNSWDFPWRGAGREGFCGPSGQAWRQVGSILGLGDGSHMLQLRGRACRN